MTNLIVYYTRTGTCKKIAEELSQSLHNCEIDQVLDEINYSGIIGWFKAAINESKKKSTIIKYKKNASSFDNVIVVTPVWAGAMTPAIREYIRRELNGFKSLYVVSSCSGSNSGKISEAVSKSVEIAQKTFCIVKKENNKTSVIKEIASLLG